MLGRIRTALIRLNNAHTPDDATLAQLVPLFEKAANIVQFSGHHAAGHFLSFLQEPKQVLATEATTSMDPDLSCDEDVRECAPQPNRAPPQPPLDNAPVASNDTQPAIVSKAGCCQPPCGYIAKQACPTHIQRAPLGTPQNPIGGSTRSRPY